MNGTSDSSALEVGYNIPAADGMNEADIQTPYWLSTLMRLNTTSRKCAISANRPVNEIYIRQVGQDEECRFLKSSLDSIKTMENYCFCSIWLLSC